MFVTAHFSFLHACAVFKPWIMGTSFRVLVDRNPRRLIRVFFFVFFFKDAWQVLGKLIRSRDLVLAEFAF